MTLYLAPKSARSTVLRLGLATALALAAAPASWAFTLPMTPTPPAQAIEVQAEAANTGKVDQLVALAAIQSDLQLGLLFLQESGAEAAAPFLARPGAETWPTIKDSIMAAGGTDMGPLLAQLQGGDAAAVYEGYVQVSVGMAKTRTALAPSTADSVAAILTQSRQVAAGLNAAGPTDAEAYRQAWAMLMTTRNQLDLLSRDPDQAVVKAVGEVALAMDDLILSLPYPVTAEPVMLDPAQVLGAIKPLEAVAGGV